MNKQEKYIWEMLLEFRDLWSMKGFENFSQENANHIVAKKLEDLKNKINKLEKELAKQITYNND